MDDVQKWFKEWVENAARDYVTVKSFKQLNNWTEVSQEIVKRVAADSHFERGYIEINHLYVKIKPTDPNAAKETAARVALEGEKLLKQLKTELEDKNKQEMLQCKARIQKKEAELKKKQDEAEKEVKQVREEAEFKQAVELWKGMKEIYGDVDTTIEVFKLAWLEVKGTEPTPDMIKHVLPESKSPRGPSLYGNKDRKREQEEARQQYRESSSKVMGNCRVS